MYDFNAPVYSHGKENNFNISRRKNEKKKINKNREKWKLRVYLSGSGYYNERNIRVSVINFVSAYNEC